MFDGLLFAGTGLIWVATMVDVWRADASQVRGIPRAGWLFVALVMPVSAAVAWCLLGRPRVSTSPPRPEIGRGWPQGPEDDPNWIIDTSPSRPADTRSNSEQSASRNSQR